VSARISHPNLSSKDIEARAYQLKALNNILHSSTLLVLPTGMGKTPIELMAVADKIYQSPHKKVIFLAPTNPLLSQHYKDAKKFLNIPEESIIMINGGINWKKRQEMAQNAKLILATPQVIRNDVNRGSLSLVNCSLLVIDEAHHASGKHAMAQVADLYLKQSNQGLILGATASPGSTDKAIINLINRIGSSNIFSMEKNNPLVKPYVSQLESIIITMDLPKKLEDLSIPLKKWLEEMVEQLRRVGVYLHKGVITTSGLNDSMRRASFLIDRKSQHGWNSMKLIADSIRVLQLINLITTQGIISTRNYMRRIIGQFENGEKKLSRLVNKKEFIDLKQEISNMHEIHNKMEKVVQLVKEQINLDNQSRIIVFASLRDSVKNIAITLNGIEGINAVPFIGQSSRGADEGMSQKKQISTLDDFREGKLNVLVATSVGEEGLDIPSADRVIFYEPVASEIRTIQRRGRTGRHRSGYVFVLVSKDTKDEGIRFAANAKENRMYRILNKVKNQKRLSFNPINSQNKLNNFKIILDNDEISVDSFIKSEEMKLKEDSKKETPEELEKNEDTKLNIPKNNLSISQKLRPSGQSGLEEFSKEKKN
jgi:ERCC4-related helicase|tara:strand:+ start:268 stop:2055 length:1788 start_codon:yes stop_codon:yes gene_type:complete